MSRNDRDYWSQERGPENPEPMRYTENDPRIEPSKPRRRAISERDYLRLSPEATRLGTTVDELWRAEQAAKGAA